MKREYDVVLVDAGNIDFMPSSVEREVLQNVKTICTTLKGTVPMDRELGINPVMIDEPVNIAKARITSELIEAIRKYEPRARVSEVGFDGDMNGKIIPHVKVRIVV